MGSIWGAVTRPAEDEAHNNGRTPEPGRTNDPVAWEVRESLWLEDVRCGHRTAEIAAREGLSPRRIQLGIARARDREMALRGWSSRARDRLQEREMSGAEAGDAGGRWDRDRVPLLIPIFPVQAFTPRSECPHHGPIRPGTPFCCMVCSQSGMDAHPALKRDPRTDPKPEPRPAASAPRESKVGSTRKEKRRARKAARPATTGPGYRRAG